MRRALILSVGTGTRPDSDMVSPLAKTVRHARPDFVSFLASAASEANARAVAARLALAEDAFEVRRLDDTDNVARTFQDGLAAIRAVIARGFAGDEVEVDFTSGTKAMTAGLVLAAAEMRCGALRYITGTRQDGIVADGTEVFLSIPPVSILAYHDLEVARELMSHLQFKGAIERCHSINASLLDTHTQALRGELACLATAYDAWDKFEHARFVGEYGKVDITRPEHAPWRIKVAPRRLIAIAQAVKAKSITEDLLADLFDNADRRVREGKYDDAVARLYRLTEMLAQRALERHGIATGDIDLARVPPGLREPFLRHQQDGKIKVGMRQAYALLAGLGDPLGPAFERVAGLAEALLARNESILAHGTRPIGPGAAKRLRAAVLDLATVAVPDFPARCAELQFPWLVD